MPCGRITAVYGLALLLLAQSAADAGWRGSRYSCPPPCAPACCPCQSACCPNPCPVPARLYVCLCGYYRYVGTFCNTESAGLVADWVYPGLATIVTTYHLPNDIPCGVGRKVTASGPPSRGDYCAYCCNMGSFQLRECFNTRAEAEAYVKAHCPDQHIVTSGGELSTIIACAAVRPPYDQIQMER